MSESINTDKPSVNEFNMALLEGMSMDDIRKANKSRRHQEKFEAKLMKEKAKLDDKDKNLVDIVLEKLKEDIKSPAKKSTEQAELKSAVEVKLFGDK